MSAALQVGDLPSAAIDDRVGQALAAQPLVSAVSQSPKLGDHGPDVEFRRVNGRVDRPPPAAVLDAELIKIFEGAPLDAVEKALVDYFAAQYRHRQFGVGILIKSRDEKHDHSLVGLDAHSIDLLARAKAGAWLNLIKGERYEIL